MVVRSLALGLAVTLAACSFSQQLTVKELATRLAKVSKSSDPRLVEKDVTGLLLEGGFTVWKTDRSVVARPAKAHGIAFTEVEIKSISESLRRGVQTKFSNIGATLDLLGDQVGTAAPISPRVKSWLSAPAGTKSKGALDEVASVVQAISSGRGLKHWPFANPKAEVDALQGAIIMRVVTEELLSQLHDPDLLAKSRMNTLFASQAPGTLEETKTYSTGYKPGLLGNLVKIWESVPGGDIVLKAGKMELGAAQAGMIMFIGSNFLNFCTPTVTRSVNFPATAELVRTRNQTPGGSSSISSQYRVEPPTSRLWAEDHRDLLESIGARVGSPSVAAMKGLKTRWYVAEPSSKPVIGPPNLFQGGIEVLTDSDGLAKLTLVGTPQASDLSRQPVVPKYRDYTVNIVPEKSAANQLVYCKACLQANGISFTNPEAYAFIARFMDSAQQKAPDAFNGIVVVVQDWDKAKINAQLNVLIQGEGSETDSTSVEESFTNVLDDIRFSLKAGFDRAGSDYRSLTTQQLRAGQELDEIQPVTDLSFLRSISKTGRRLEQTPGNGKNFESSGWFNFFETDDRDAANASASVRQAPQFEFNLQSVNGQWIAKVKYSVEITGDHHSTYKYDWSDINDYDRNAKESFSFAKSSGEITISMKKREGLNGEEIFEGSLEVPYELEGLKKKTLGKISYNLTINDYTKVNK